VFEEFTGVHVAVGGVDALELGVPVFVQGIAHISCNTTEESFPDGPGFACELPLLFHTFLGMCCGSICNCWIVGAGFCFLDPCQIHEMVVFVFANDFGLESILLACGLSGPVVCDIVQFTC
jgi:hypothetical protein